jgi:endonuclease YncB( thermonuclease family)
MQIIRVVVPWPTGGITGLASSLRDHPFMSRHLCSKQVCRMRSLLALLLFSFVAVPQAHADRLTGVASVIDGDTLEIRGQRIRLHGIDAPESRQLCATAEGQRWRCGQEPALDLADRIGRRQVSCTLRDIDRYGRFIAVCHQDGTDLNGWLVREGWAVADRRYSRDYIRDETEARSARRNIWSERFDMPWDWRRAQRGG